MRVNGRVKVDRGAALVALLKMAGSAVVLASGFRAVSDDDFARVVIAEQWAHQPRIDPSGSSWLPFPFWITGAALALFGRSLLVARGTALALGVAAALVVYVAARWMTADRRSALVGAGIAAVFPWSARLGVAPVPELPTAALTLLSLAALVPPAEAEDPAQVSVRRRLVGGLGLLAATLSRYEAWPIAVAFALLCGWDARGKGRGLSGLAAVLPLVGPAAWMAWNRHVHGDALHFVARVAAYRRALGGAEPGALVRLTAYPLAMLREEPELSVLLVLTLIMAAAASSRLLRERLGRFARPAALTFCQIAALSLAMVKDSAPTHHPERAMLLAYLLAALVVGDLAVCFARAASRRTTLLWGLFTVLAVGVVVVAVRPRLPRESFAAREGEVAVGLAGSALIPAGTRVLVEVVDYGHLAVVAALGRPEDAVLDRSIDPRDPPARSSFEDAAALAARSRASGVGFVIGRPTPITAGLLGEPAREQRAWAIWRAPSPQADAATPGGSP
jgi:4-amino-4-deoxy-L-arabinose transferase-like glycosyltransferase